MVTVTDPLGAPTIIYNRSGKVIIFLAPNDGTAFANAVEIPHLAEETFVFINPPLDGDPISGAIKFASDFDIGDRIVVHANHITALHIYDDQGSLDPVIQLSSTGSSEYIRVSTYSFVTWVGLF